GRSNGPRTSAVRKSFVSAFFGFLPSSVRASHRRLPFARRRDAKNAHRRRMTRLNRTFALLPVLVLLLSGCGVAVSPTSTPRAVSPSSSPRTSSPSPRPGSAANPSVGADQDLERRLPDRVGSEPLHRPRL